MRRFIKETLRRLGYRVEKITPASIQYPILRPTRVLGVEILADKDFQDSCKAIGSLSLLDTPRLANLWILSRMTDPRGAIAEVGSYKGGSALHLSNACPDREILVFDGFSKESFDKIEPGVDHKYHHGQFADHSKEGVERLLEGRKRRVTAGFFPASAEGMDLPKISFVHLDVDVYHAIKDSLLFLLNNGRLLPRSLIVVDDYNRGATGVNKAVAEVLGEVPGTAAFPMFPSQALVVPASWSRSAAEG